MMGFCIVYFISICCSLIGHTWTVGIRSLLLSQEDQVLPLLTLVSEKWGQGKQENSVLITAIVELRVSSPAISTAAAVIIVLAPSTSPAQHSYLYNSWGQSFPVGFHSLRCHSLWALLTCTGQSHLFYFPVQKYKLCDRVYAACCHLVEFTATGGQWANTLAGVFYRDKYFFFQNY